MTEVPSRARVVVIGGGVVGTSVAYHLTRLGWTDVVLLEQGRLSCGTTWHAAGLVGQLRASESGTRLVQYSSRLYSELEAETGLSTGYRRCGGVTVARTRDRMVQLRRTAAAADAYDLECQLLTPAQALERWPAMQVEDLVGAIWLPGDGRADPTDLTTALAKGARQRGARVLEQTRVLDVLVERGAVTGVRTDRGDLEADVVVNCAGQWAKQVGALAGVNVPLHSAEHFYVVTEPVAGVHRDLPILRDPDGYTYVKEEVGGLVVGGFEPEAKPWVAPDRLPHPFEFQLLEEDWDHFSVLMESAVHRIPALESTGIRKFYNGPESFTPDNQFILGAAPEVRGFYVGAGFNSVGIASAGGAGRALAEWIVEGEPTMDLTTVDIRRFAPFAGNVQWLHDRVGEVLGLHYEVPWPNREMRTARPFRRSPVHHLLDAAGASFGSRNGWERPNWFVPGGSTGAPPSVTYTWGKPDWLPWVAAEHASTRSAVTVFDQTSFSKLLVVGPDVEAALQWICTADVAVEPGRTVYTGVLNARGTYESDVTLTRLSPEEYLVVSSAATTERDKDHLRRNVPLGMRVTVVDLTSAYAVFGVMGPRSRELLSRLSRADLGEGAFPFGTSREIDLGYSTVRATRLTYVGELGWELYASADLGLRLWDVLYRAGRPLGVIAAGRGAFSGMRLEKGYRLWGTDMTTEHDPYEAGLGFAVKLDKGEFVGREALLRRNEEGPRRKLSCLLLDDPSVVVMGSEPVYAEGRSVGYVTSAAYGYSIGQSIAYAWLPPGLSEEGAEVEIEYFGERHGATVAEEPLFDPAMKRMRG
jgi:glycine cleavage system aminomethyltransferase T/glycine/D-amino acid oxidase-like deaminating enzyme